MVVLTWNELAFNFVGEYLTGAPSSKMDEFT